MNLETFAIARENLISRGIHNPNPDEIAKEAQRMYEANKADRVPTRLFLMAFMSYASVSLETVAEFIRKVLNL